MRVWAQLGGESGEDCVQIIKDLWCSALGFYAQNFVAGIITHYNQLTNWL